MIRNLWPIWIIFFYASSEYVCFYWIDWLYSFIIIWTWSILYNFFCEKMNLKSLIYFFSKNILWLSLLNLCCIFNVGLLLIFMISFKTIYVNFFRYFTLLSSWVNSKQFSVIFKFNFFMTIFFVYFDFLSSLPSSIN